MVSGLQFLPFHCLLSTPVHSNCCQGHQRPLCCWIQLFGLVWLFKKPIGSFWLYLKNCLTCQHLTFFFFEIYLFLESSSRCREQRQRQRERDSPCLLPAECRAWGGSRSQDPEIGPEWKPRVRGLTDCTTKVPQHLTSWNDPLPLAFGTPSSLVRPSQSPLLVPSHP